MVFGGLGSIGRSLLSGISGVLGVHGISLLGDGTVLGISPGMVSSLANISGTLGQYRAHNMSAMDASLFGGIQSGYTGANMSRQAANMYDSALDMYGRALQYGQRSGNGYQESGLMWDTLTRSMRDYRRDIGIAEYNRAQQAATYSAVRSAARLSVLPDLASNVLNMVNMLRDGRATRW